MRFAVTGAAGFIGSHLSERLVGEGHEVVGIDSLDDFYDPAAKVANLAALQGEPGFTLHRLDVRDARGLEPVLFGIDAVIHLAARAGVRPSLAAAELYFDVNVRGTAVMLELVSRLGVPRFVLASSSSVYGEGLVPPFTETGDLGAPASPYAATKLSGERLCEAFVGRIPHLTALRLFSVYGPRQRPDLALRKFARLILADEPIPVFGETSSFRDYTYIDDIVDGVMAALGLPDSWAVINLGSGRPITLEHMITELESALGRPARRNILPRNDADLYGTWADLTAARRLLGYEPTLGFAEGIGRLVDWHLEVEGGLATAA